MVHPWEHIADQLHAAGYSYGYAKAVVRGRLLWVVDACRDGHRYAVRGETLDEAFPQLGRRATNLEAGPWRDPS